MSQIDAVLRKNLEAEERLTLHELERAQLASTQSQERLDRVLVGLGLLSETERADLLARAFKLPRLAPQRVPNLDEVGDLLAPTFLRSHGLVPLSADTTRIAIAMTDPVNQAFVDSLAYHLGREVEVHVGSDKEIEDLHASYFPLVEPERDARLSDATQADDVERLRALANDGPVVQLVQRMLTETVDLGASDLHVEGQEGAVRFRVRVHGALRVLHVERSIDPGAIYSRLKVLAGLNVSERVHPQDGRITSVLRGREVDFRVSSVPTQTGESVVVRVLDPAKLTLSFTDLGFAKEDVAHLKRILARPSGLVLLTGPTGSGKTTTLYAALSHLSETSAKICTVEDPVEYTLPGLNQTQIRSELGLGFAQMLRALLRQDPNVLMIGEIRDPETAQMACRAALVGRLILSTLHVSSPEEAILRLQDLEVAPYLIESVLTAALGQSLDPVICGHCGGAGCTSCGNTGVAGRKLSYTLKDFKADAEA